MELTTLLTVHLEVVMLSNPGNLLCMIMSAHLLIYQTLQSARHTISGYMSMTEAGHQRHILVRLLQRGVNPLYRHQLRKQAISISRTLPVPVSLSTGQMVMVTEGWYWQDRQALSIQILLT